MSLESLETWTLPRPLEDRVLTTLRIADRWGYGLPAEDVARLLYGGSVSAGEVTSALASSPAIAFRDGVATLPGRNDLVEKAVALNRDLSAEALSGLESAHEDPLAFRGFCRRFREEHPIVPSRLGPLKDIRHRDKSIHDSLLFFLGHGRGTG